MQVNVFCWKASTQQSCHLHCTTAAALQPECVCVCACVSHEHHLPLHHSEPRRLVKALGGELGRGCEAGRSSCSPCLQVVLFCPLSAHGSPERRLMTCSPSGDKQDRCACNDKASVTEEWQTCYVHSMSELNAAGFISTFTCVMCCYGNL